MAQRKPTERTNKFLEVNDPKKAVGLWSYHAVRETAMTPVGNTFKALGRFLPEDIARWKCRGEMGKALKDVKKGVSAAKTIANYQEICKDDEKRLPLVDWRKKYAWLLLWQGYSSRLTAPAKVADEPDVQMFFNAPSAGVNCHEGNLHSGRMFFLRTKVKVEGEQWKFNHFVAVVLKPGGTKWWSQIDKTNVTWTDNVYDRLIMDPRGGLSWSPILAEVINERVNERDICLFKLEDDALFKAITDNELNPNEKYAHLCYEFDFFCRDAESEKRTFYMRWSVFFNPSKAKFEATTKQKPRIVEVMGERKKGWIARRIEVKDKDWGLGNEAKPLKVSRHGNKSIITLDADDSRRARMRDAKLGLGDTPLDKYVQDVAQWVAANNGCAVLPAGVSRELRLALAHALFFVTFPNRKPDEPGGILRGYQLPGRLVEHAQGLVRPSFGDTMKARIKQNSEDSAARRRKMVVDCLFTRACTAVALRNKNVIDEKGVVARMNEINARATLEKAAWLKGFMEGNPLNQFKPGPLAGILKLPDLSLALCFERKLGLKGETAGGEMLVQTTPINSLKAAKGAIRVSLADAYPCRSLWTPKPGQEKEIVAYPSDSVRILRDQGRYYLMAVPRYGQYNAERDLAFKSDEKGNRGGVPISAYRIRTTGGVRSRSDNHVVEETFEFNKVMKLARDGRVILYSIDFGRDNWLADLVYSTENKRPCKVVPTIPLLAPKGLAKSDAIESNRKSGTNTITKLSASSETAQVFITFTFNPSVPRDNRKVEGRSWKSYLDAFPAEARREVVRWNGGNVKDALRKVIETDGVLLTDKDHLEEALRAATYVIPAPNPESPIPNPYQGYILKDRIFKDSDGRVEWRIEQGKTHKLVEEGRFDHQAYVDKQRKENRGKPLCEILSPDLAKVAEAEFTRQIEADTLVDAKTPKDFKLEEPIRVTDDFKEAVAREFRRIAYTGTMGWRQKLNRPAHEVAIGIWLAGLKPVKREEAKSRSTAFRPVVPTAEQKKRLKTLDALLAEGLVTQEEYDAKKAEILGA